MPERGTTSRPTAFHAPPPLSKAAAASLPTGDAACLPRHGLPPMDRIALRPGLPTRARRPCCLPANPETPPVRLRMGRCPRLELFRGRTLPFRCHARLYRLAAGPKMPPVLLGLGCCPQVELLCGRARSPLSARWLPIEAAAGPLPSPASLPPAAVHRRDSCAAGSGMLLPAGARPRFPSAPAAVRGDRPPPSAPAHAGTGAAGPAIRGLASRPPCSACDPVGGPAALCRPLPELPHGHPVAHRDPGRRPPARGRSRVLRPAAGKAILYRGCPFSFPLGCCLQAAPPQPAP